MTWERSTVPGMRLRELLEKVREVRVGLASLRGAEIKLASGTQGLRVEGLTALRQALATAGTLPLGGPMKRQRASMLAHPLVEEGRDGAHSTNESFGQLRQFATRMSEELESLDSALTEIVPPAKLGAFAVKLPESNGGIDSMAEDLRAIATALEQPLRRLGCREISVVGVDRGTSWVELLMGPQWVALVTALVGAWGTYRREKLQAEKVVAEIEKIRAETAEVSERTEYTRLLREDYAAVLKAKARRLATEIVDAEIVDDVRRAEADPEAMNAVVLSIQQGAELLGRGVEVVPLALPEGDSSKGGPGQMSGPAKPPELGSGKS